jgi:hypothetical protein
MGFVNPKDRNSLARLHWLRERGKPIKAFFNALASKKVNKKMIVLKAING